MRVRRAPGHRPRLRPQRDRRGGHRRGTRRRLVRRIARWSGPHPRDTGRGGWRRQGAHDAGGGARRRRRRDDGPPAPTTTCRRITAIAIQQLFVDLPRRGRPRRRRTGTRAATPLDAAVLGYVNVAALRQHIRTDERIHGVFTDGGDKPNIVPAHAAMHWYVRSGNPRVARGAEGRGCSPASRPVRQAAGCTDGTPVARPGLRRPARRPVAARALRRQCRRRSDATLADPNDVGAVVGSTDMGNVSHEVPSIHPMIAVAPPGIGDPHAGLRRARPGRGRGPGRPRRRQGARADRHRPAGPPDPTPAEASPASSQRFQPFGTDRPAVRRGATESPARCRAASSLRIVSGAPAATYVAEQFTDDERAVLRQYFTNLDGPGLRPRQPPRGGQGRAVRPLLPLREVAAPAVHRRVRGRARHRPATRRSTPPSASNGPRPSTTRCSSSTATTASPSSAGSTSPVSRRRTC